MKGRSTRAYRSLLRQGQAESTRGRIADAAHRLLTTKGYAGMTVDALAKKAGVAPQTVYAVFGSKRGVLAELMDRATFGPEYQELVATALHTTEPAARLRYAASIARRVHEAKRATRDLLRGAGVVAPELSTLERTRESRRYDAQQPMIEYLAEHGHLRPDVPPIAARDILWTLTSRDVYRMLVHERGWSSSRYERWLADQLVAGLLKGGTTATTRTRRRARARD
jgi:AcrR family transcriptional regulator